MRDYQTFILSSKFSFHIKNSPRECVLSDVARSEVEAIWDEEQRRRKGILFNGSVLSLVACHQNYLVAEFVEYKVFLSYIRKPGLRKLLGIKPLGLSCLTSTPHAILIGRRSKAVMQYPLWYELAPSGGIDAQSIVGEKIDVVGQAIRELKEETGYVLQEKSRVIPFAIVCDPITDIYEVCVKVEIDSVTDCDSIKPTAEYDRLEWVVKEKLSSFIERHSRRFIPLSQHLLHYKEYL